LLGRWVHIRRGGHRFKPACRQRRVLSPPTKNGYISKDKNSLLHDRLRMSLKRLFKRNTHNSFFKALAGFGRSMNRFYENRNHDALSNGEYMVLKKLAKTNPRIILDVGANVGNYAKLVMLTNPKSQLYCFEPVQSTFNLLKENLNTAKDQIHFVNQGLYSANTTLEINIYPGNEHASVFNIKGIVDRPIRTENIDMISLDSFLSNEKIEYVDFVKLDLEGAEMQALVGMEQSLALKKIRAIQFEYGYINITTKNLLADYYDFFGRHDFILGKIYPKAVEFRDYKSKHEDFIGPNFIAVHRDDDELISILRSP
jgi:FkbM family methyltransferase